jgi:hypothetical protein
LPDFEAEAKALAALAQAMVASPPTVLQKLAVRVLELCQADSAGVGILEPCGENGVFLWHATAGRFAAYFDGTDTALAQTSVALRAAELALVLGGIDWSKAHGGRPDCPARQAFPGRSQGRGPARGVKSLLAARRS